EWVLAHGDALPSNVRWLLPSPESFQLTRDKAGTLARAQELGIPCPRTYIPASLGELEELVAQVRLEDFVVKPRTGSGSSGVIYGSNISTSSLGQHWQRHGPLLLQERIPATGVALGVSMLFDRAGRETATFAHRRLREYPVSGGPSTQRVSEPLDGPHAYSRQ